MFTRRISRAIAVAAGLTVPALGGVAAFAVDDGEVPDPLTTGQTVLIFVAIPLAISAVILLLTMLPSWFRSPRYRPTRSWDHDPMWFGGPAEPTHALMQDSDAHVRGGGASAGW